MSSDRRKNFKNFGKDTEELRRRRNTEHVELRKAKKDDQISKRRNIQAADVDTTELDDGNNSAFFLSEETVTQIIEDMMSCNRKKQLDAVQKTRKILSREKNPPIDVILKAGIVPICVAFLSLNDHPEIQFEAAWVLTNVASGTSEQTAYVVQCGAIDPFIELLESPAMHVADQAIWALGNIAGDGPRFRDMIISKGAITRIVALSVVCNNTQHLRNLAWTISNLCRTKDPPPPIQACKQCLPLLAKLIHSSDMETIGDACWALSYLSDGPDEKIDLVIKANVVTRLVELLDSNNFSLISPCLRTVGNIVTGNDSQTDVVVNAGVLPRLAKLLRSHKNQIVKEAAWAVSNIVAGTKNQIASVISCGILPTMIDIIRNGDFRSQKEAAWVIANITSGGSLNQIIQVCQLGAVSALCDLLVAKDAKTVSVVLDALDNILQAASSVQQLDKIACAIEECGGLENIEKLQNHENEMIYHKAYKLIENYLSDEDGVDENLLPVTSSSGELEMKVSMPNSSYDI